MTFHLHGYFWRFCHKNFHFLLQFFKGNINHYRRRVIYSCSLSILYVIRNRTHLVKSFFLVFIFWMIGRFIQWFKSICYIKFTLQKEFAWCDSLTNQDLNSRRNWKRSLRYQKVNRNRTWTITVTKGWTSSIFSLRSSPFCWWLINSYPKRPSGSIYRRVSTPNVD